MSRATNLCKKLEKLMGKKNESFRVDTNDEELFSIELNSATLSEFNSKLEALIPTLKLPPAKRVKPMVISLLKFIKRVLAATQYYPLENIECNLWIDSYADSPVATFTFSGIGKFYCDEDDDDEIREENYKESLETFRSWDEFMGKYSSRHIVETTTDWDLYDQSFYFEVEGEIR